MADILKTYIKNIKELPTLPAIAGEILSLTNDPLLAIDDLMNIIEIDPAISAKILSVANSAFFAYPVRTTRLNDAIMRIGINNVKSIAVGIAVLSFLDDGKRTAAYVRLYNHSVAVGLTAQFIANNIRSGSADDIMTDGLLHDLGYLVLYRYFPEIYREIQVSCKKGGSILEAEREVLSYTHADIGFWLADQWKLPKAIVDTIAYHHLPSCAKRQQKQSAIVHIADYITAKNIFSPFNYDPEFPLDHTSFEILSISDSDMRDMEESIADIPLSDEVFMMSRC